MATPIITTLTVLVLTAIAFSHADSSNPYCKLSPYHTLCLYTNTTWASACGQTFTANDASTVTSDDIATILTALNNYRRYVAKGFEIRGKPGPQPKASNMRQLVWDSELALVGQVAAQQCSMTRSLSSVSRFPATQVLFSASSAISFTKSDWNSVIKSLSNEVTIFPNQQVDSYLGPQTGAGRQYPTLVWANSYAVGCGVATFKPAYSTFYQKIYVCNFAPAALYTGQPVYIRGEPGSACPAGTSNSDGLCV